MYVCLQKLGGRGTGDIFPPEEALTDNLLNFAGTPKVKSCESWCNLWRYPPAYAKPCSQALPHLS